MTVIRMSRKELGRLQVLVDLADGRADMDMAAALLGVSRRQAYRFCQVKSARRKSPCPTT